MNRERASEKSGSQFIDTLARFLPVLLLLLLVMLTYSNTVDDSDFWWHLKHGEFIYTTHGIPQKDDFAFTTYSADRVDSEVLSTPDSVSPLAAKDSDFWVNHNIKQGWLAQLLFYIVYLHLGFSGIAVLKASVFALTFLVAYLLMLKRGAAPLASFLIISLSAVIIGNFDYTRPQIFSFLFFPCMLYMLHDFRAGGRTYYGLPILMLLWANLHGGFILGVIVLMVFFLVEAFKYLLIARFPDSSVQSLDLRSLKKLLIIALAAAGAGLLNPNGYQSFLFPFHMGRSVFRVIEEYGAPRLYEYHAYWGMLVLAALSIVTAGIKRRLDLTDLAVSAIVILGSLRGIRFIPFFVLATAPVIASALTASSGRLMQTKSLIAFFNKRPGLGRSVQILPVIIAVLVLLMMLTHDIRSGRVLRAAVRENRYPSAAAAFIKQESPRENMFNPYSWGGYLIWTLGPRYKTFIDGRNTNETAFVHYNAILLADAGADNGHPLWKKLLDAYGVNMILVSAVSTAGVIHPLVDRLSVEPGWKPVFADGKSLLFLRDTPENRPIIASRSMPRDAILDEIVAECEAGIKETPATWGYYEILGHIYYQRNRPIDALRMFDKYLSMNPYNKDVRTIRDILRHYAGPGSR